MRRITLLIATAIALSSCASVTPVSFSYSEIYFPEIGVEETEELGATLLSYVNVAEMDSYRIVRQIQTKKNIAGVYSVFPPQVLRPIAVNQKGETLYSIETSSIFGGLSVNGPSPFKPQVVLREGEMCFAAGGQCFGLNSFTAAKYVDVNSPSIRQELIYNGRTGDSVKFLYREITGAGMLRSPFNQEVNYDLSEGSRIGFKGARFDVIKATNRGITYRVLQSFDKLTANQ